MIKRRRSRKAQVWIETVLYTLIGLALIGIILAIALPKINASKDRLVVEQTIESLGAWDKKINEVMIGPGNVRAISAFLMKRGDLYIDAENNLIYFRIEDLSTAYSEPGIEIKNGEVTILSEEVGNKNSVQLTLDYSEVADLTNADGEDLKKFTSASTPYSFRLENLGSPDGEELFVVNITETSRGNF